MKKIQTLFLSGGSEVLLKELDRALQALSQNPEHPENIGRVFQSFQAIKTATEACDLKDIAAFLEHFASAFSPKRRGRIMGSARLVSDFRESRDQTTLLMDEYCKNHDPGPEIRKKVLEWIRDILAARSEIGKGAGFSSILALAGALKKPLRGLVKKIDDHALITQVFKWWRELIHLAKTLHLAPILDRVEPFDQIWERAFLGHIILHPEIPKYGIETLKDFIARAKEEREGKLMTENPPDDRERTSA